MRRKPAPNPKTPTIRTKRKGRSPGIELLLKHVDMAKAGLVPRDGYKESTAYFLLLLLDPKKRSFSNFSAVDKNREFKLSEEGIPPDVLDKGFYRVVDFVKELSNSLLRRR